MKITMSFKTKLSKNWAQKLCMVIGFVMFFFGLWQIDLIAVGPVWGTNWISPAPRFADHPFEMGRVGDFAIGMTVGTAYDLCQTFLVLGLAITVLSLWYWENDSTSTSP
jgi:cytochrome c biogenesis protein CcdA